MPPPFRPCRRGGTRGERASRVGSVQARALGRRLSRRVRGGARKEWSCEGSRWVVWRRKGSVSKSGRARARGESRTSDPPRQREAIPPLSRVRKGCSILVQRQTLVGGQAQRKPSVAWRGENGRCGARAPLAFLVGRGERGRESFSRPHPRLRPDAPRRCPPEHTGTF